MIFFFYGEDSFRAQQKIKNIRDKFKAKVGGDGYNIEYLDGDLLTIAEFFKSIRSGGFLVTKKPQDLTLLKKSAIVKRLPSK